jgi:hypothetical protein
VADALSRRIHSLAELYVISSANCKDRWPKRGVNWAFSNSNAEIKQP